MTSDPKAPGARAIILSYEESEDAETYETLLHVRIKVLTEAGREAANVKFPGHIDFNRLSQEFFARTIHPDGSITPFVSTPENTHVDLVDQRERQRVAALSGVTVGCIVEFGYHFSTNFTYDNFEYEQPTWLVQRKYFTRAAHFSLKPPARLDPESVRWVAKLPAGAELKRQKNRIELDLTDIPPDPDEEFMPPPTSTIYNVRFYYYTQARDKFWGETGAHRDYYWSTFYSPGKVIKDAVAGILQPTDSDDAKLHKLYDAVQQFENTDLTRARSLREDKKNGLTPAKNSEDVWNRKRGDSDDITLLFIALARAAGYEAYPMELASRNEAIFSQDVLSWGQLDSMVAIVTVGGHERFFDPGTRRCTFGHLAPWHANVIGVSTEAKLVKIRSTPGEPANSSRTDRVADLTIDAAGGVSGTVTILWYQNAGLDLRRSAVSGDEETVHTAIEHDLRAELPSGVEIKLRSLDGLANPDASLIAKFTVSGTLGTATAKRLILPAQFFASTQKPVFAAATRTEPVAFPTAKSVRDQMTLHLPAGFSAETMPEPRSLELGNGNGNYTVRIQAPAEDKNFLVTQRISVLNRLDYKPEEYDRLHKYFGSMASYDQDQIILRTAVAAASTGSTGAESDSDAKKSSE